MNFKHKLVQTAVAAGLVLTLTTGMAYASIGTATVTGDALRLRSEASTASTILATAAKGTEVEVLEDTGSGWYKVLYGEREGYMSAEWLRVTLEDGTVVEEENVPQSDEPEVQMGIVIDGPLNVRAAAGTDQEKVGMLNTGASVNILDDNGDGWYQISTNSLSGWVSADYVRLTDGTYSSDGTLGAAAAGLAAQLLGCRYSYGAAGPNAFDCSGVTSYIYKQLGHPIGRGASSQYYNSGWFVPVNEMQPGDLIFFFDRRFDSSGGTLPTTHVGMFVGNGQFIHASTTSYRVQYDSIYGYYAPYIVAAKRIG